MKRIWAKIQNSPIVGWLSSALIKYRSLIIIPLHVLLFCLSYYCAFILKFDEAVPERFTEMFVTTLAILTALRVSFFAYFKVFQGLLRYVSLYDLVNILKAVTLSSLVFTGMSYLLPARIPKDIIFIDWLLMICLTGGLRVFTRLLRNAVYSVGKSDRALLIGSLPDLKAMIGEIRETEHARYFPILGLDEDFIHRGISISGVPIYADLKQLPKLIRKYSIEVIIFCSSKPSTEIMNFVVDECTDPPVEFKLLPTFDHLMNSDAGGRLVRELNIEDLLERPPIKLDESSILEYLRGKRVLVTGAGGSIGRELCLQMTRFEPGLIILFDRYEGSLYSIELELTDKYSDQPIRSVLGTISDVHGFSRILDDVGADVIFHCAAYKHVPVVEMNPLEAGYNNILGTRHIANAAIAHGVEKFIMISTDKAVNPTSVMGASKRLAEMYTQGLNKRNVTKFVTVRFGNVLNSAGSVIPRFVEQVESGGPVTVTHPDIERFFMTIPEACQLVLQATVMGAGGEIFVLNMGKPIKIIDVAKKLIRLAGKTVGRDVEIVFTGLRPGEKLYEELFDKGEVQAATTSEHIFAAMGNPLDFETLEREIWEIERMVFDREEAGIVRQLNRVIPNCSCGAEILAMHGETTEDKG